MFFALHERSAAFTAEGRHGACLSDFLIYGQIISAAVSFDGVHRNADSFTDFRIGRALEAEFRYGAFLFIGHEDSSNPRIPILMVKQKKAVGIEGVQIKKACEHSEEHPQAIVCADIKF